jgi:superfamily II DNA or RNA helicase
MKRAALSAAVRPGLSIKVQRVLDDTSSSNVSHHLAYVWRHMERVTPAALLRSPSPDCTKHESVLRHRVMRYMLCSHELRVYDQVVEILEGRREHVKQRDLYACWFQATDVQTSDARGVLPTLNLLVQLGVLVHDPSRAIYMLAFGFLERVRQDLEALEQALMRLQHSEHEILRGVRLCCPDMAHLERCRAEDDMKVAPTIDNDDEEFDEDEDEDEDYTVRIMRGLTLDEARQHGTRCGRQGCGKVLEPHYREVRQLPRLPNYTELVPLVFMPEHYDRMPPPSRTPAPCETPKLPGWGVPPPLFLDAAAARAHHASLEFAHRVEVGWNRTWQVFAAVRNDLRQHCAQLASGLGRTRPQAALQPSQRCLAFNRVDTVDGVWKPYQPLKFCNTDTRRLRDGQRLLAMEMLKHRFSALEAPCGFGKTVTGVAAVCLALAQRYKDTGLCHPVVVMEDSRASMADMATTFAKWTNATQRPGTVIMFDDRTTENELRHALVIIMSYHRHNHTQHNKAGRRRRPKSNADRLRDLVRHMPKTAVLLDEAHQRWAVTALAHVQDSSHYVFAMSGTLGIRSRPLLDAMRLTFNDIITLRTMCVAPKVLASRQALRLQVAQGRGGQKAQDQLEQCEKHSYRLMRQWMVQQGMLRPAEVVYQPVPDRLALLGVHLTKAHHPCVVQIMELYNPAKLHALLESLVKEWGNPGVKCLVHCKFRKSLHMLHELVRWRFSVRPHEDQVHNPLHCMVLHGRSPPLTGSMIRHYMDDPNRRFMCLASELADYNNDYRRLGRQWVYGRCYSGFPDIQAMQRLGRGTRPDGPPLTLQFMPYTCVNPTTGNTRLTRIKEYQGYHRQSIEHRGYDTREDPAPGHVAGEVDLEAYFGTKWSYLKEQAQEALRSYTNKWQPHTRRSREEEKEDEEEEEELATDDDDMTDDMETATSSPSDSSEAASVTASGGRR